MQSAKKITLVPPKSDQVEQYGKGLDDLSENTGSLVTEVAPKNDKVKSKIYDKIHKFIKIILKLARSIGYDNDLRIKLKNGTYLEKSNIVDLLTHAMSVGKVLYGESEFIELLSNSGVDPSLIINENVRMKLIQYLNKGKIYQKESDDTQISEVHKRKRLDSNSEDNDDQNSAKKRKVDDPYKDMPVLKDQRKEVNILTKEKETPSRLKNNKKRKHSYDEDISDQDIDKSRWDIPSNV